VGNDDHELVVTPSGELNPASRRLRERVAATMPENARLVHVEHDAMQEAEGLAADGRPWALVLEVRHLDMFEKASLAGAYTMSVLDDRTGDLVVVPPSTPRAVETLLAADWLSAQHVVLTPRQRA
jgi:hypothetical protein